MNIEEMKEVENDWPGVTTYNCGTVLYINICRDTVVSDHTHAHEETIFLLEGLVQGTIGTETKRILAPAKITIPPNTYHKFVAWTEVRAIELIEK